MKTVAIVVGVLLLILFGAFIYWIVAGAASLADVRDISIVILAFLTGIMVILVALMVGLLVWLLLLVRDRAIPLLEKSLTTAETVKGTTAFVSESVVSPIIKMAGAVAGAKGMVQAFVGRQTRKEVR